ncbi:MAG: hypothetical protein RSB67_03765 [Clostridia bacterium]
MSYFAWGEVEALRRQLDLKKISFQEYLNKIDEARKNDDIEVERRRKSENKYKPTNSRFF